MANTITQWKPFITTNEGDVVYNTYAEIKKNMKTLLQENDRIRVCRSRRGEWGEWFEYWELVNSKPTITRKGWM